MSESFDFAAEYAAFGDELKGVSYEGEYDMVVQKAVAGATQKGKQQFTLTLGFTSGPYKAKNKTVIDRLIWSPESDVAARIFAANLRVLGAPMEWIMTARPTPDQIAERITGAVFSARLRPDEFNGQPTTRVSYQKSINVKSGNNAPAATPGASAAKAVTLDDDTTGTAVTPTAAAPATSGTAEEAKEPVSAGTGAADNPWA
jgi:hypothetical protein